MHSASIVRLVVGAVLIIVLVASPQVSPSGQLAAGTTRLAAANLDPRQVTAFVDEFMARNMTRYHAPGASVAVVNEGSVIFEKGYGYADLSRRIPYTPTTRFRAKSVSKTFTATAVMQLLLPYAGLNGTELDFGPPTLIRLLFGIPVVTAVLALALAVVAALVWRSRELGVSRKLHFIAVAAGALLFPAFLEYWKLFGLIS